MADEQTERIAILLQARDRDFQRAMDRNNKLIARFAKQAERELSASAKTIEGNLARMGSAVSTGFKAFVALEVVQGVARLGQAIRGAIGDLAELDDSAKRAGVSVEALQKWRFVAGQSGVDIEAVTDGLRLLSLRADEVVTSGGGPAAGALRELGFEASDLAERLKDPSALMLEIIGRMEGLSAASQIRLAADVFGRSGGAQFVQLLGEGEDGIREMMQRAEDLGLVLDDRVIARAAKLDDKFAEVTARVDTMWKQMAVGVAGFVADMVGLDDQLDDLFDTPAQADALLGPDVAAAIEAGGDAAVDAAAATVVQIGDIYSTLGDRIRLVRPEIQDAIILLSAWGETDAADALREIDVALGDLNEQVEGGTISADDFEARLSSLSGQAVATINDLQAIDQVNFASAIGAIAGLQGALHAAVLMARALRASLPGATESGSVAPTTAADTEDPKGNTGSAYSDGAGIATASPQAPRTALRPEARDTHDIDFGLPPVPAGEGGGSGGGGGPGGGGGGAAKLSAFEQEVKSTRDAIADLELEAAELVAVAAGGREVGDALDYARKRAELLRAAMEAKREVTPELRAEVDALALAYVAAGESAEMAANRLKLVEENAKRGADRLTEMFTGILDGSASAKDALKGLILDIAQAQLRAGLAGLLTGAGGGALGLLGGLLGGARASGGGVQAGVPYLVNEGTSRSEVMVPSRSGAVLNVPQAQAALRGAAGGSSKSSVAVTSDVRVTVDGAGNVRAYVERSTAAAIGANNEALAQSQRRAG